MFHPQARSEMGFLLPLAFWVHGLQAVDLMALRGRRGCSRVHRVLFSFLCMESGNGIGNRHGVGLGSGSFLLLYCLNENFIP